MIGESDADLGVNEVPGGLVPLASPFYVERTADAQLRWQLKRSATITTVRGAQQTGKTSLLFRGMDYARKRDALVIYLDFQQVFGSSQLSDIDSFLRHFAYEVAAQALVSLSVVDIAWEGPVGPLSKVTQFVENLILGNVEGRVVLAMDETDILLKTPFCGEFFGLLRAWHNRRAFHDLWQRLSVAIAVSAHPSLLIDDVYRSPFNVGLVIRLGDFDEAQVRELNERHGGPLRSGEISEAMEFLGGHPYLIRQALHMLVCEPMTWSELVDVADKGDGPYSTHLRCYLSLLNSDEELMEAMRQVVIGRTCPEGKALLRLTSVGLVQRQGRKCVCRYGLYERFFRSQLR